MTKSPGLPLTATQVESLCGEIEDMGKDCVDEPAQWQADIAMLRDQANAALTLKDERDKLAAENAELRSHIRAAIEHHNRFGDMFALGGWEDMVKYHNERAVQFATIIGE
jgi:hypothetical protein